ncbi:MAG: hypothetical protein NTY42_21500 [Planctomycetota bacterium]|nr:hypothetical protein [Planctomycetota bacterium]
MKRIDVTFLASLSHQERIESEGKVMFGIHASRIGLAALMGASAIGFGASNANAQFGYTSGYGAGHHHHGRNCPTPVYSYRPVVVVPNYGYGGYNSFQSVYGYGGIGYPSYSSYRGVTTVPSLPLGGYGVGGFPRGASWGGGGMPPGASWGGGGRGISLYIGR